MNVTARGAEIAVAGKVGQRVRIHVLRPFREARMAEGVEREVGEPDNPSNPSQVSAGVLR